MSKKKRKNRNKGAKKPRSRASSLRGKQENIETAVQKSEEPTTVADVRADLRKTAILTAACLGILLILSLTQPRWFGPTLRF